MTRPLKIQIKSAAKATGDHIVLGVFERSRSIENPFPTGPVRRAVARTASQFRAKDGYRREGLSGKTTIVLWGLPSKSKVTVATLGEWANKVASWADSQGSKRLVLVPPQEILESAGGVESLVRSLVRSNYRFDRYLEKEKSASIRQVQIVSENGSLRLRLERSLAVAEGVDWCRDLANTPPNVATPEWMAQQAKERAQTLELSAKVLTPRDLKRRGMGGLLAVGGGSSNSPRLVQLQYGKAGPSVALVGKGVTFDTGGISIKPSASMEEMKYDKCGACTALGITHAVATLGLPIRLTTYLPLAENMPDGNAYRPGDIVTCYGGKTVEIHNTDAEGRMILADALGWAVEEEPEYVVDFATLTGACVVALGEGAAGLYARDDAMASQLLEAASAAEARLWRMPLWPEFVEQMKGNHADLKNSGERWGGANTAAAFLSEFTADHPKWAHIDIAGPAYSSKTVSFGQSGATGYGVELTVNWLTALLEAATEDEA